MGPKILTVDDSKTIRLIVARAFKPFDCHLLEAANGVEGLALAAKERPDLIILDLTMPVMDGYETLSRLKSDPDLKSIPVVMLTAEAGRENVLRIAKQGVRDYLVKPFKEELIVERVGRIIDLKPKGSVAKAKRFDDPLSILVIDDKPAIADQIRAALADTRWTVGSHAQSGEAIDNCSLTAPDAVLISLSLPEGAAYHLFQLLRSNTKTKAVPVFALCVKTALEEQAHAQQVGFNAVITKPIDANDLKSKIARVLSLDTSYRYFEIRNDQLLLTLPAQLPTSAFHDIARHLRTKAAEAVDSGIDKLLVDLSAVKNADVTLVQLGLEVVQLCTDLSLKYRIVASPAVAADCRSFQEAKEWKFADSVGQALAAFGANDHVPA